MDKMSTLESVFRGASGAEPRVFSEKGAATQGYWEDLGERSVESATHSNSDCPRGSSFLGKRPVEATQRGNHGWQKGDHGPSFITIPMMKAFGRVTPNSSPSRE